MASELEIQEGLQTAFRAMSEFADADVVINDWSILDAEIENSPYILIANADRFSSSQEAPTPQNEWDIHAFLWVKFDNWNQAYNDIRTYRQAMIDKTNEPGIRSAGGLEAVNIHTIRSGSDILPFYDPYLRQDELAEALPIFIYQDIIFECEEF